MHEGGSILALDLATAYGWSEGSPGGIPLSGSGRFAPAGSSHGAVASGCIQWFADRLAVSRPAVMFIERPGLHSVAQGKSSFDVIFRLLGLAFTAQGVANMRGLYDVRFVDAGQVRQHFLGSRNMPGEKAKALVQRRCRELGWAFQNPDEADSLALWSYGCEAVKPGSGHPAAPGMFKGEIPARKPKAAPPERMSAAQARDLFNKPKRTP